MLSLADFLQIAVVIYWLVFWLFSLWFRQKCGYFFFANSVNFSTIFFSCTKATRLMLHHFHGLLVTIPFFLALACTVDAILSDMASIFQIWSTVAGNTVILARGFEVIWNKEIFWMNYNTMWYITHILNCLKTMWYKTDKNWNYYLTLLICDHW